MIPRLVSHSPSTPVPKRTAEEEAQHCDDVGRCRKERGVMKSVEQEDKQLTNFTSCSIHKSTKTWEKGGKYTALPLSKNTQFYGGYSQPHPRVVSHPRYLTRLAKWEGKGRVVAV